MYAILGLTLLPYSNKVVPTAKMQNKGILLAHFILNFQEPRHRGAGMNNRVMATRFAAPDAVTVSMVTISWA